MSWSKLKEQISNKGLEAFFQSFQRTFSMSSGPGAQWRRRWREEGEEERGREEGKEGEERWQQDPVGDQKRKKKLKILFDIYYTYIYISRKECELMELFLPSSCVIYRGIFFVSIVVNKYSFFYFQHLFLIDWRQSRLPPPLFAENSSENFNLRSRGLLFWCDTGLGPSG